MVNILKREDWGWKDNQTFFFGHIKFEMLIRRARGNTVVGS